MEIQQPSLFTRRVVVMEDPGVFEQVQRLAGERGTASAYIRGAIREQLRSEEQKAS